MRRQSTLRQGLCAALALTSWLGCGPHGLVPQRASHAAAPEPASPTALQHQATRAENLRLRLHPRARELLLSQGREESWVRDGVLKLPLDACVEAVRTRPASEAECTLLALDHGAVALLVMREASCTGVRCMEQSWVFLSAYPAPLPLPERQAADYHALRAELPSDAAAVLWLAGFRGARPVQVAEEGADDPYHVAAEAPLPARADYTSCTLAPDEQELLCRSEGGDVLGLNVLTGAERLVVELGIPEADVQRGPGALAHQPAMLTADRKLALFVRARHALCEGQEACDLVARVDYPVMPASRVRFSLAPW